ncbi:hypothetical protein BH09VER1_BH09VER1_03140 [soil metagenome]
MKLREEMAGRSGQKRHGDLACSPLNSQAAAESRSYHAASGGLRVYHKVALVRTALSLLIPRKAQGIFGTILYSSGMPDTRRKTLPHQLPWSVDVSREIFFVTICTQSRAGDPLLPVVSGLLDAVRFYHAESKWWAHLVVIMPDHLHALLSFTSDDAFTDTVRTWKRWTARQFSLTWQRDFFDHRLRRDESYVEKSDYILQNPVRAGLVDDWEKWPHLWFPDR